MSLECLGGSPGPWRVVLVSASVRPMTAQLFGSRLSPFVEKVARALQLKGVPFDVVEPRNPGDFKKWNPQTQKMPVLDLGDERIWDSTRILERLEVLHPQPSLYASDQRVVARQRFLEDWSDEALYWYVMAFRWQDVNAKASAAQVVASIAPPAILQPVLRVMIRRQISAQAKAQGLQRLPLEMLVDQFSSRVGELVGWLDDSPFFFSDRPSIADLAIFGQVRALRSGPTPQGAAVVEASSGLMAWVDRVDEATRG